MISDALGKHFLAALKKADLTKQRDVLLAEARECIHFFCDGPEEDLPVGASKVGGNPDLPDSIQWPDGSDDDGKPHGKAEFLAQFDLAQVPAAAGFDLPRTGHLWLFVRNASLTSPPTAVFYLEGGQQLKPRKKPESNDSPQEYGWRDLGQAALTFELGISLPLSNRKFMRQFSELGDEFEELRDHLAPGLDRYGSHDGIDGQLGGYSFQAEIDLTREHAIQEMGKPEYIHADQWDSVEELEKQIQQGLPFLREPAKLKAYQDQLRPHLPQLKWIVENDQEIQARANALQLLCMFRPNDLTGLEFGDGMYLDFLVHRDALAKRDFSNVYCDMPMLL